MGKRVKQKSSKSLFFPHQKQIYTCTNGYSMVVHLLPKPPVGHSPISGKAIQHPAALIIMITTTTTTIIIMIITTTITIRTIVVIIVVVVVMIMMIMMMMTITTLLSSS